MLAVGRSPRTVAERLRVLHQSGLDVQHATVFDVEDWLAGLDVSPATRRAYTDALRSFYGWAHTRGLRPDNPAAALPTVRVPKGKPRPITTEQLHHLLATARRRRLRGYLLLGAYAGLRVSEIAHVRGEHINDDVLTVAGKGGTVATLPLHPLLVRYAATMPPTGWWFPSYSHPDEPVDGSNVSRVVADHMRRRGVPGTAHQLRHWFASTLTGNGAGMRVVQEGLRHANLQTVQVYTHVSDTQLREAILTLPAA